MIKRSIDIRRILAPEEDPLKILNLLNQLDDLKTSHIRLAQEIRLLTATAGSHEESNSPYESSDPTSMEKSIEVEECMSAKSKALSLFSISSGDSLFSNLMTSSAMVNIFANDDHSLCATSIEE